MVIYETEKGSIYVVNENESFRNNIRIEDLVFVGGILVRTKPKKVLSGDQFVYSFKIRENPEIGDLLLFLPPEDNNEAGWRRTDKEHVIFNRNYKLKNRIKSSRIKAISP